MSNNPGRNLHVLSNHVSSPKSMKRLNQKCLTSEAILLICISNELLSALSGRVSYYRDTVVSSQLSKQLSLSQNNDIQTCTVLSHYQGEISQPRTQSVRFVSRGLGFDPWWSGSLRLGGFSN